MKQLNKHALISTMILAGAVGFTSCSSDNDLDQTNTTPGKSEMVKTQFAINIPNAGKVGSRMSDEIVQNGTVFRGMTNIQLLPFVLSDATGTAPVTNGVYVAGDKITDLEDIVASDVTTSSNPANPASTTKIYQNIEIPMGTNAFLFYGEAISTDQTDYKKNGKLTPLLEGNAISTYSFSLSSILGDKSVDDTQTSLLGILNDIAQTPGWSTSSGALNKMYYSFISLKAGSSTSIRLTIENLYNKLQEYEGTEALKNDLITEIKKYFKPSDTAPYTLTYNDPYKDFNENPYPASLGLPAGSVQVKWDNSKFTPTTTGADLDHTNANVAALTDYVYPASLYYTTNTPVKVSNKTQSKNYTGDWDNILNLYDKESTAVTATTQSVALVNKINYAVGRFDVKAYFAAGDIKDKKDETVTIDENRFELVGVLVGGQKNVGWDFMPKANADAKAVSIYDAAVTSTHITQTAPDNIQNSTLVLATNEATINFVIELKNKGEKFEGTDGIIHKGATFYLLGKLDKNQVDNNNQSTNPQGHPIFGKDLVTTATVKISSLANAYNCIPDLKAPKLELGLSVDLTWETGLTQDVEIP